MKAKPIIIAFSLVTGVAIYSYLNKGHRDIATEKSSTETTSDTFHKEAQMDEKTFNESFLDKTIVIKGTITDMDDDQVILDHKILVTLIEDSLSLKLNSTVRIKGRYVGYDELLDHIKIDQASLIN